MENWPFKVEADDDGKPLICVKARGEYKKFHPEEVSSMILQYMKGVAENYLSKKVE